VDLKTRIPVVVTLVCGLIVLAQYFVTVSLISDIAEDLMSWVVIIQAFATGLGAVNLIHIHGANIQHKRGNLIPSYTLLLSLFGFLALGLIDRPSGSIYSFFFSNLLEPLSATLFACNAFFITSAASRAFVLKNRDAGLLLACAVLVMLGRVGIGEALWSGFPLVAQWIMDIPNGAGMRGIIIGSALGAIASSLRIILGYERSHFGEVR